MTTTTTPRPAIEATGLRKAYREHVVLDGVDLRVPEATVFAVLGPNGAGKTTTVQILSTLIRADGGTARVCGHDLAAEPDRVRAAIGVTGQFSAVDNLRIGRTRVRGGGAAGARRGRESRAGPWAGHDPAAGRCGPATW